MKGPHAGPGGPPPPLLLLPFPLHSCDSPPFTTEKNSRRQSFNSEYVFLRDPPLLTPAHPIAGPPRGCLRQGGGGGGSADSPPARFWCGPPHPLSSSRRLSARISYWQEGVRSKQRRPAERGSGRARGGERECEEGGGE